MRYICTSILYKDIASKASSYRLLAGTNEFAEDLTGQRMALNASQWKSETGVMSQIYLCYYFIRGYNAIIIFSILKFTFTCYRQSFSLHN